MGNHALLSPSSSHRWLQCTPSAVLETEFENKISNAAEEGTAAHALCEHKLKKALRRRSKRPVSPFNTDEMEEHSDAYVEFVLEQLEKAKQTCPDPLVLIEQKVDLSDYVPGAYGTADCLIVSDNSLHIIDMKYGLGVLVDAEENSQLKCYGIAALSTYESLYDIKEVSLSIFQPRRENVQTWTVSVEELKSWAENELKPKAQMAAKGDGEYCPGDWCQFCRAAVKCRARAAEKLRIAEEEFKLPPLLMDEEIEEILPMLPDITKWANEISAYLPLQPQVQRREVPDSPCDGRRGQGGVHLGIQPTGHGEKGDHRQCGDHPQNALRHRCPAGKKGQAGGRNGGACGNDAEHRGGERLRCTGPGRVPETLRWTGQALR